jgi:hypothetical protein
MRPIRNARSNAKRYYQMKTRLYSFLLIFTWTLASLAPAFAGDLVVTRYFSGLWDQTHHESQGIVLQIIDQEEDGAPKAVAYWFTYGEDLGTAWYMAIGHVEGDQVLMELYTAYGVEFLQDDVVEVNPVEAVGTLTLWFKNCNKGTASYTMGEDVGEFDISRLAALYNSRCSGGISDNTPSDAKPLMLEVALLPPADDMAGKGKARFWERSDRTDFHVSAEDLTDGDYEIHVCGINEGSLIIADDEGATRFRSPEADGKLNLTFDPRDCLIEVQQAGTVYLTSGENVLAEKEKGPKDKGPKDNDKTEVSAELQSTGLIDGAEGEVEYEVGADEAEFEVEFKGVPAGTYGFFVDGTQHGGDIVVAVDGDKAKLKFSDPQKDGSELLTFVPWDAMMEIRDGSNNVVLEVAFPGAP